MKKMVAVVCLMMLLVGSIAYAAPSWSGTWNTDWGKLVLAQNASDVNGSYDGGSVKGVVDGMLFRGTWSQSNGASGKFQLTISENGNQFSGTWTTNGSSEKGTWSGKR